MLKCIKTFSFKILSFFHFLFPACLPYCILTCFYYFVHHRASLTLSYGLHAFLARFSGILYAVGGYDGATRQCLSTVEAYNPKSNTWSYIAEMGTRRSGAGECVKLKPTDRQNHSRRFICQNNMHFVRRNYAAPLMKR